MNPAVKRSAVQLIFPSIKKGGQKGAKCAADLVVLDECQVVIVDRSSCVRRCFFKSLGEGPPLILPIPMVQLESERRGSSKALFGRTAVVVVRTPPKKLSLSVFNTHNEKNREQSEQIADGNYRIS